MVTVAVFTGIAALANTGYRLYQYWVWTTDTSGNAGNATAGALPPADVAGALDPIKKVLEEKTGKTYTNEELYELLGWPKTTGDAENAWENFESLEGQDPAKILELLAYGITPEMIATVAAAYEYETQVTAERIRANPNAPERVQEGTIEHLGRAGLRAAYLREVAGFMRATLHRWHAQFFAANWERPI